MSVGILRGCLDSQITTDFKSFSFFPSVFGNEIEFLSFNFFIHYPCFVVRAASGNEKSS
jgi:hypothetical protein